MTKIDFYIKCTGCEMADHVVSLNANDGLIRTGKAGVAAVVALTGRADVYRIWGVYIDNGEPIYKVWQMAGADIWSEKDWGAAKEYTEILPVFN